MMTKRLSERQRKQFAACLALLACGYILLAAKEYAASVLAARSDLPKLEWAVRLSPGNADYWHRLGRYYAFVSGDSLAAIKSYQSAVHLNPFDASYWFDLAAAYQVTGDINGQRAALDRALQAEPTAPHVAWEAANFFLVTGDVDRALREFNVVIGNDISLIDASLQASWRVRPDADVLLREVVPPRTDTLIPFLTLMMGKHETEAAIKTWDRISQLHEKFANQYLFDYVRYLVNDHRPDAAMSAWEQASSTLGLTAYLPSEDNLVVNGDFSLDILNGGFDWNY
ncbi:MAG TPA: hypothetical protein VF742_16095, partial [Terracidiphilus sp.]